VVFIVALFLTKNKTIFQNKSQSGLVYNGNEKIEDLVNRDTDGDGVSDWEEGLFGTDPTRRDTNGDGILDSVEIAKLQGQSSINGDLNLGNGSTENLSQTEQLSRELLSTLATLNQAGSVDQTTVDTLSNSLIAKIQDSGARKIFRYSDLKIIKNDTRQDIVNYNNTLTVIYKKYPFPKDTVIDIIDEFVIDEETVDESVLAKLDPIIKQYNNIIAEMVKMNVPEDVALLHLATLNSLQKLSENLADIRLYENDIVVSVSALSQYDSTTDNLIIATNNLLKELSLRLK